MSIADSGIVILRKLRHVVILVLFLFPLILFSQEKDQVDSNVKWLQLGLNSGVGLPQNEFKQEYQKPMLHGGVDFMIGIPDLNLMLGAEYRRINIETTSNSIDDTIPVGGGLHAIGMDTDARSRINVFHLSSRFVPLKEAKVSPYIGVSGGFKALSFRSERTAIYQNDEEILDENTDFKFAFSYGGRIGLLYRLQEHLKLDVSAQWQGSSRAKYPGDITFDSEGIAEPSLKRSKTDMLIMTVGIVFVDMPE